MKKKVLFCIAIALVAFFCVVVKRYGKYAQYVYYFVSPQKSFITNDYRLNVDTDTLKVYDSGYGDWLVHPCVRYIPDGLGGQNGGWQSHRIQKGIVNMSNLFFTMVRQMVKYLH